MLFVYYENHLESTSRVGGMRFALLLMKGRVTFRLVIFRTAVKQKMR